MALRLNGSSSGYVELDVPAAAGSHTLTLPDGGGSSGQYLQTDGSGGLSWAGAGKILQVKQIYKQDTFTTTSTSFTDVTGLSLAITPSSASNYILVCSYFVLANTNTGGNYYSQARLIRDSTEIFAGTAASNRPGAVTYANKGDITIAQATGFIYRDSPATTSEVTYKIQLKTESSGTASIGRTPQDADTTNHARMPANIVLMEVAG